MYQKIIIISGGRLGDPAFYKKRLAATDNYLTICCDGGIRHLEKLKIQPDVIIGDMDSADEIKLTSYKAGGVKILKYPPDKDVTDTQLALEYALKLKPEAIEIWSALGGRIDHTLANLFLLNIAARQRVRASLVDEYCEAFIAQKETTFTEAVGQTVSLFALSSFVEGIVLRGFRYPLDNETLEISNSRGISNIVANSPATINVGSGSLLIIRYRQKYFFPEAI